jgi:hypothetical protein
MAEAPLHLQKLAVKVAHDILEELYPARVAEGRTTQAKAAAHLAALADAVATIDRLDTKSQPATALRATESTR